MCMLVGRYPGALAQVEGDGEDADEMEVEEEEEEPVTYQKDEEAVVRKLREGG